MVHKLRPNHSCTEFTKDSESSSCNSSTPSSPFLNPHKESYTPSQGLAFEFPGMYTHFVTHTCETFKIKYL